MGDRILVPKLCLGTSLLRSSASRLCPTAKQSFAKPPFPSGAWERGFGDRGFTEMQSLFRYLRLFAAFGRFSLLSEMAFRANYLLKVTVEILWIVLLLFFYRTIFAQTSVVADWSEAEYMFFLGCYYALEGLMETLFLGNCTE